MKKQAYWLATILLSLGLLMVASSNLRLAEDIQKGTAALGYPIYLARMVGFWTLLAVPALLGPGLSLLKEWTYAGLVFLFTGAAYSHLAAGQSISTIIPALVFLSLALVSWGLRPADRRIARHQGSQSGAAE